MTPTTTSADVNREAIRGALYAIAAHNNGILNPHHVLDVARDPQHILHPQFEWDDAVAGEAYRLAQVGGLVRSVRMDVFKKGDAARKVELTTTRGFQSRPSMRSREGGYEPVAAILADTDKRAELIAQVLRELTAYRKRYAELSELEVVWTAVDDVQLELSPSAPEGDSRPGAAV
jgi:hypothetical protein